MPFQKGNKFRFKKGHTPWNKEKKCPWVGEKNKSLEMRNKVSEALTDRKLSEGHKRNLVKAHQKKQYGFQNGHPDLLSKKVRKRISKLNTGKKQSEETKQEKAEAIRGEKNGMWKGGISFEPYSLDWTKSLRQNIRKRDNYICQLCGEYGNTVHHIDYNKKNCNPNNLIILCRKCNSKLNSNRKYWIQYFYGKQMEGSFCEPRTSV